MSSTFNQVIIFSPLSIIGIIFCRRLGTFNGSMAALIPWFAGILGDLGHKGSMWPWYQKATVRLEIASFWISAGCILAVLLNRRLRMRIYRCIRDRRRLSIWAFLLFYVTSYLWAPPCGMLYPGVAIMSLLAYAMVGSVLSFNDLLINFKCVIVCAFLLLALSLFFNGLIIPGIPLQLTVQYDNIFHLKDYVYARRVGLIPSVATDGAIIALSMLCTCFLFGASSASSKRFALFSLVVVLMHLVTIQARWILFICVGLCGFGGSIVLVRSNELKIIRKLCAVGALAAATLVAFAFIDNINFLSRGSISEDVWRKGLYQMGWHQVVNGPLIGKGFGSSTTILERANGLVDERGNTLGTHNSYLFIGLEMGIAGMVLWITLLARTFLLWTRVMIKSTHRTPAEKTQLSFSFILGFLGIAFMLGGTLHTLISNTWLWYMLLFSFDRNKLNAS